MGVGYIYEQLPSLQSTCSQPSSFLGKSADKQWLRESVGAFSKLYRLLLLFSYIAAYSGSFCSVGAGSLDPASLAVKGASRVQQERFCPLAFCLSTWNLSVLRPPADPHSPSFCDWPPLISRWRIHTGEPLTPTQCGTFVKPGVLSSNSATCSL